MTQANLPPPVSVSDIYLRAIREELLGLRELLADGFADMARMHSEIVSSQAAEGRWALPPAPNSEGVMELEEPAPRKPTNRSRGRA